MTDASAREGSAAELDAATTVVAVRDQASAALPGETIILGMEMGVYYGVVSVGARIWDLVASPTTLGAVHEAIVREYEVAPDVAWRDLVAFVVELRTAGLVLLGEPAS